MKRVSLPVVHQLLDAPPGALDRYQALLEEDQALRHTEYDRPDPRRRRLRVSCNECRHPWCCNQRVTVDLVEALAIWRFAAARAPAQLAAAVARGQELAAGRPLSDDEFFRRRAPCPFLLRGRCAIFAVRPYRCRTHYMGGNPLKCRDELTPSETYEMSPDRSLWGEAERVADDIRFEHGLPDDAVELSQAMAEVARRVSA